MTRNSVTLDDLDLGCFTRTPAIHLDYSHKKSWPLGQPVVRPHSSAVYVVVFYSFILQSLYLKVTGRNKYLRAVNKKVWKVRSVQRL